MISGQNGSSLNDFFISFATVISAIRFDVFVDAGAKRRRLVGPVCPSGLMITTLLRNNSPRAGKQVRQAASSSCQVSKQNRANIPVEV